MMAVSTPEYLNRLRSGFTSILIDMVWLILDRKADREAVSNRLKDNGPYHGKSPRYLSNLDQKRFRYSGVDTAIIGTSCAHTHCVRCLGTVSPQGCGAILIEILQPCCWFCC